MGRSIAECDSLESKVAGILEMLACIGNKEECVQGGGVPWNYAGTNGDPVLATAVCLSWHSSFPSRHRMFRDIENMTSVSQTEKGQRLSL